jgi:hypothetical protein
VIHHQLQVGDEFKMSFEADHASKLKLGLLKGDRCEVSVTVDAWNLRGKVTEVDSDNQFSILVLHAEAVN